MTSANVIMHLLSFGCCDRAVKWGAPKWDGRLLVFVTCLSLREAILSAKDTMKSVATLTVVC